MHVLIPKPVLAAAGSCIVLTALFLMWQDHNCKLHDIFACFWRSKPAKAKSMHKQIPRDSVEAFRGARKEA